MSTKAREWRTFLDETDMEAMKAIRSHHLVEQPRVKKGSRQRKDHGKCRKVRYRDHREAVDALMRTQLAKERQLADGLGTRRKEVRTYFCGRCKGHHLTSKVLPVAAQFAVVKASSEVAAPRLIKSLYKELANVA